MRLLLQLFGDIGDPVNCTIELLAVVYHEIDIGKETLSPLVLVALRLILHIFEGDWIADMVTIVWCILPRWLIMEEIGAFQLAKDIKDLHKDIV